MRFHGIVLREPIAMERSSAVGIGLSVGRWSSLKDESKVL